MNSKTQRGQGGGGNEGSTGFKKGRGGDIQRIRNLNADGSLKKNSKDNGAKPSKF